MTNRERIEAELKASLKTGSYKALFVDDLLKLWEVEGVSPEVVLREVRALEGASTSFMEVEGDEPIPVWAGDERFQLNLSSSATKRPTQFSRKKSPLKGLWHKHYFVSRTDFINQNVENQTERFPSLSPMVAMLTRLVEAKVTGEWIIYKQQDGIRTYLCLATHPRDDAEEQKIAERIAKA